MEKKVFLIHELAEVAGVSVRTVRYYTDEGLLPLPDTSGKFAAYSVEHLNRLELIRKMKDAFFPLREIRESLKGMSPEEVVERLAKWEAAVQVRESSERQDNSQHSVRESALEYISSVMDRQSIVRAAKPPSSTRAASPVGETWRRIEVVPGIELHLREPHTFPVDFLVQQIREMIQRLPTKP